MTIYYRGRCARITHEVFEQKGLVPQSFKLTELRGIRVTRGAQAILDVGTPPVRLFSKYLAAPAAVAASAGWLVFHSPPMFLAASLLLVSSLAAWVCCRPTAVRPYELWVLYRGQWTLLFAEPDRSVFGQVKRALGRAIEAQEDTAW